MLRHVRLRLLEGFNRVARKHALITRTSMYSAPQVAQWNGVACVTGARADLAVVQFNSGYCRIWRPNTTTMTVRGVANTSPIGPQSQAQKVAGCIRTVAGLAAVDPSAKGQLQKPIVSLSAPYTDLPARNVGFQKILKAS